MQLCDGVEEKREEVEERGGAGKGGRRERRGRNMFEIACFTSVREVYC